MEGVHSKAEEARPQLLDLIPNKREWMVRDRGGGGGMDNGYSSSAARVVEKRLELRLGPPGDQGGDLSSAASNRERRDNIAGEPSSLLSLGLFTGGNTSSGAKRGFLDTLEDSKRQANFQPQKAGFFGSGLVKEEAGTTTTHNNTSGGCAEQQQHHRPAAASHASANAAGSTAAGNNSNRSSFTTQSRPSQPPVVGWPPVRSFRKNIAAAAASSSKPPSSSRNGSPGGKPVGGNKSTLVKINMDGVPIGRKVDLSACSGYDGLSAAVDQLFRGLLAAQRVMIKDHGGSGSSSSASSSSAGQHDNSTPAITGLLDGSGEYTLVYEDNEGDRVLVGDVPWEMFVSTVKRLRVLKSSDLPSSLSLGLAAAAGAGTRKKESPRDLSSSSPDTAEQKRAAA